MARGDQSEEQVHRFELEGNVADLVGNERADFSPEPPPPQQGGDTP
jgi:hypothetical protein